MKGLKDQVDLRGPVEVITVSEFRRNPGECLAQVELGKTYCITRYGKPVAYLGPDTDAPHEVLPNGSCASLGIPAKL